MNDTRHPYIGTQVSLISFHRFGVARILDTLQETCGVNAVRIHADTRVRSTAAFHDIHGSEEPHFNLCGLPLDPANYRGAPVRSQAYMGRVPAQERLGLLAELRRELDARGMQLQIRNIVGADTERDSFSDVLMQGLDGQVGNRPCWNNPHFHAFMRGIAEDAFRTAPIRVDGYLHMAEYSGGLSQVILGNGHLGGACFCAHCRQRGAEEGIDVGRAGAGYRALAEQPEAWSLTGLLRHLMHFPEILAWERMQWDAYHEIPAMVRGIARQCRSDAEVGVHVISGWSFLHQVGYDFGRMSRYCDFLKPIFYTTMSGMRMGGPVGGFHRRFLHHADRADASRSWMLLHGMDPDRQPVISGEAEVELDGADFVASGMRSMTAEVQGRCPIYANVGWHPEWEPAPANPTRSNTYRAVRAAIDHGADGIFLSRQLCPDAIYGGPIEATTIQENSAGGSKQKVEGDVGAKSLALYAAALRDAGWI